MLLTTAGLALGASGGAAELASLASAERAAAVELFATEVELTRAQAEAEAERHAERERALAATRERLLVRLYVEGDADPIEVIFGARSLGAVLEGIDGLERSTRRNRELAAEARRHARALEAELADLTRA